MHTKIAISIGDPAGIGPEIILKSLSQPKPDTSYVVFGARQLFDELASQIHVSVPTEQVEWKEVIEVNSAEIKLGLTNALAGQIQVVSLKSALDAVLKGEADAICTAPITKASAHAAGFNFPGHTEYLAHRCQISRVVMMLAGPKLRVVPLTIHIPLKEVPRQLGQEMIIEQLAITIKSLHYDFGLDKPRVAVAALNPHAGEEGLMGDEEQRLIMPALNQVKEQIEFGRIENAEVIGPLPADGLFAHYQDFDVVMCCYHDQALIPLKMLHRDDGVNVTLGLPIVRTSPAHGSALDIAGKGIAKPDSFIAALNMAKDMARQRRKKVNA